MVTALHFTIFTNFFTPYDNPRQLVCYYGVVSFEFTSGFSMFRKSRIHPMANRTLKKTPSYERPLRHNPRPRYESLF
ncbi:transposase [Flagellimonas onchidii]|uniref:transposase n=1 Tax=Flagellimonas onchidii TaxID=2562684 RepID=UPI0010A5AC49